MSASDLTAIMHWAGYYFGELGKSTAKERKGSQKVFFFHIKNSRTLPSKFFENISSFILDVYKLHAQKVEIL